jgi:hypothetical protein
MSSPYPVHARRSQLFDPPSPRWFSSASVAATTLMSQSPGQAPSDRHGCASDVQPVARRACTRAIVAAAPAAGPANRPMADGRVRAACRAQETARINSGAAVSRRGGRRVRKAPPAGRHAPSCGATVFFETGGESY